MDDQIIVARALSKTYRFHRQQPGLGGAIRGVLRRRYETRLAVDRIDLLVRSGEFVGVLGRNGAGKSTTLKMFAGLVHPSGGTLEVLGFQPHRRDPAYLRRIAMVTGQKSMLWWDIPAMDTLLLHKEIYRLSGPRFDADVRELAGMLDVADLLRVQVRKVSLGERMKLELLVALVHRPEILFLDEPTIGLDVVAKERVRAFLRQLNERRRTTILLTSHDMTDIGALCRRTVVIEHGRIQYDGRADLDAAVQLLFEGQVR